MPISPVSSLNNARLASAAPSDLERSLATIPENPAVSTQGAAHGETLATLSNDPAAAMAQTRVTQIAHTPSTASAPADKLGTPDYPQKRSPMRIAAMAAGAASVAAAAGVLAGLGVVSFGLAPAIIIPAAIGVGLAAGGLGAFAGTRVIEKLGDKVLRAVGIKGWLRRREAAADKTALAHDLTRWHHKLGLGFPERGAAERLLNHPDAGYLANFLRRISNSKPSQDQLQQLRAVFSEMQSGGGEFMEEVLSQTKAAADDRKEGLKAGLRNLSATAATFRYLRTGERDGSTSSGSTARLISAMASSPVSHQASRAASSASDSYFDLAVPPSDLVLPSQTQEETLDYESFMKKQQ